MQRLAIVQITKKTLYINLTAFYLVISPVITVSIMSNIDPQEAYAVTTTIPAKYQTAITKIRNEQIETGSMVSEHVNELESGHTIVKMLEIPEHQLSDIIRQWRRLGHEINRDTIHNEKFIKYLVSNANIRTFNYTAKIPMFYFLVKNELAEPILYGGQIKKFFKLISFPGWFKVAGAIDAQGNYKRGYEHLGTQKEALIDLFSGVLSEMVKGSYTIIELYTDENGERKGRFKFFKTPEQTKPTLEQPIDVMAAFVLTYSNLVQENPGDIGVKKDLTRPIVEKLIKKAKPQDKIFHYRKINLKNLPIKPENQAY
ncbi:MAG: hypothetical protein ACE5GU_13970 [Candidatus Scalinduaceae bacterium]